MQLPRSLGLVEVIEGHATPVYADNAPTLVRIPAEMCTHSPMHACGVVLLVYSPCSFHTWTIPAHECIDYPLVSPTPK